MVKEELSSEEKFFEKAVMTEKFVKKYKNVMIASVAALVLFVAGSITYTSMQESRIAEANEILLELQKDSNNSIASARLESLSPALYDLWRYSSAVTQNSTEILATLEDSKSMLIADLASYESAQRSNDLQALEQYSQEQNAIYKDLALLQSAVLLIEKGETQKAHLKLGSISQESPLFKIASAFMHYGAE